MQQYKKHSIVPFATAHSELSKAARMFATAAILSLGSLFMGCETSHTESDKPGFFGGNTHEETTTTHNPVTGTNDTTSTETKTP